MRNTFHDIMFYEKKALKLDKIINYSQTNQREIDDQMNLSEFLQKITNSQIGEITTFNRRIKRQ